MECIAPNVVIVVVVVQCAVNMRTDLTYSILLEFNKVEFVLSFVSEYLERLVAPCFVTKKVQLGSQARPPSRSMEVYSISLSQDLSDSLFLRGS